MKWKTLQHNGILFPPPYEKQGFKIKIRGEEVEMTLEQEGSEEHMSEPVM